MKSYVFKSGLLALLITLISHFIPALNGLATSMVWVGVIWFYSILNMLFSVWLKRAQKASPLGFSIAVNGMTLVKMFITLCIITVYILNQEEQRTQFAIGVFVVFALNSALFVLSSQGIVIKG